MDKKAKKKRDGRCYFCQEDDYDVLDVHRITPGEKGGLYTEHNTVTTCASCHRKCHSGRITIDRWYNSTSGRTLHFWADGIEHWR